MTTDEIFSSVLTSAQGITELPVTDFLLCTAVSLVLGLAAALIYMFRNSHNKGFVVTLALLPAVVQLVIMLVNGNLGAGLAVMGAFALVRFRSIPGSAKDIAAVFFSMAIGLATGMGFLAIAVIFTLVIGAVTALYQVVPFGEPQQGEHQLKVTIPETLDYEDIFTPVFEHYTHKHELTRVKTVNMGSLYKLTYTVSLKHGVEQKAFIDELRTRNGNLEIALGRPTTGSYEL
ncbi:MAG: DUF4956 domain-containing protein [Coriobacteriales bacterium]|jgi:uncharacterized membrane protein YhiD involved in acid resistance|nr:DUF4956 domain-containing protein [Coriobacteriales bacterium]